MFIPAISYNVPEGRNSTFYLIAMEYKVIHIVQVTKCQKIMADEIKKQLEIFTSMIFIERIN